MSFYAVEERTPATPHVDDRIGALFDTAGACVVRGLYTASELAPVLSRLERAAAGDSGRFRFSPRFEAYSFGRILDQAASIEEYLVEAERYRAGRQQLYGAEWLEPRLLEQLQLLASGSALEVPQHVSGTSYLFASIRAYPPQGLVPPHFELEQLRQPTFAEFKPRIDENALLSFIVLLGEPEAGGELTVYDVTRGSADAERVLEDRGRASELLASMPSVSLPLAQGDLLVFNGGSHFHEVRRILGQRSRWTLGGFCAKRPGGGYFVFS